MGWKMSGMHPIPFLHKEWNGVENELHAPHSTPVPGVEWGGIQVACTLVRSCATRGWTGKWHCLQIDARHVHGHPRPPKHHSVA